MRSPSWGSSTDGSREASHESQETIQIGVHQVGNLPGHDIAIDDQNDIYLLSE